MIHLCLFGRSRGWPQVLKAIANDAEIKFLVLDEISDGLEQESWNRVEHLNL